MNWKYICLAFAGFLIFGLGFLVGGMSWDWSQPGHDSLVAFWAMIGGWVSGLATLAAVVVSMVLAYQGSQAGVEKLAVTFDHIYQTATSRRNKKITSYDTANIRVTNMRNVTAQITNIRMRIDGVESPVDIGFIKQQGKSLPYVFTKIGETWEFAFSIVGSTRLDTALLAFKYGGTPTFIKGDIIIQTTIKQYKLKMKKDLLDTLRERYKIVEQREAENKYEK